MSCVLHPAFCVLHRLHVWSVTAKVLKIMNSNLMLIPNSKYMYIMDPYGTCSVLPNLPHMEIGNPCGPNVFAPRNPMGTHISPIWADTWDHLGLLLYTQIYIYRLSSHDAHEDHGAYCLS